MSIIIIRRELNLSYHAKLPLLCKWKLYKLHNDKRFSTEPWNVLLLEGRNMVEQNGDDWPALYYTGYSWGAGIETQWLEHWTRDRKVAVSNPCWSGGRIFFSQVNFLHWLLFRYPFHPHVTAVAHKRPWSFCQKCRWQVTVKHACTLRMWLCMKWYGACLHGVHTVRRDGISFMWHQPCKCCKHTTSVHIQKRAIKSYSLM